MRDLIRQAGAAALREMGLFLMDLFLPAPTHRTEKGQAEPRPKAPPALHRGDIQFGAAGAPVYYRLADGDMLCRPKLGIGPTRSGKSTWALMLMLNAAKAGCGGMFIDNADGEGALRLYGCLPENVLERTDYLDFGNPHWPPALALGQSQPADLFALDDLVGFWIAIFETQFGIGDMWRTKDLLRHALLAELEDHFATLLEVQQLLVDSSYRARRLSEVKDPEVRRWWSRFDLQKADRAAIIDPLLNKLSPLLASRRLRHIVCQQPKKDEPGLDFRRAMDESRLLIIRAPEGACGGPANARMIVALCMARLWAAALSRDDIPKEDRRPFLVMADEPQTWLPRSEGVLGELFSKAAKYRLGLITLFQSLEQVRGESPALLRVILANQPDLFLLGTSAREVEPFSAEIAPWTPAEVAQLPRYHMLARIAGHAPFRCQTLGVPPAPADRRLQIQEAAHRFGAWHEDVAADIARRQFGDSEEATMWSDVVNGARSAPSSRRIG